MRLHKRGEVWFVSYTNSDGKRKRESTGCTDKRAAEIEGAKRERAARDPDSAALQSETVERALLRLIERTENPSTKRFYVQKSGHLCGILGAHTPLVNLRMEDLAAYVKQRAAMPKLNGTARKKKVDESKLPKVSAHTIAKEVRTFSTALRLAKKFGKFRGDIDALIPTTKMEYTPKTRNLALGEVIALVASFHALYGDHAARIAFAVATSAEWSALVAAQRGDVSADLSSVRVRGSKSAKRDRVVPIVTDWQRKLLEFAMSHTDPSSGALFAPWAHRRSIDSLTRACVRAGIERCTWHDLRRTSAQLLLADGAGYESLAAVLGHSTTHVTQTVYAQLKGQILADRLRAEVAGSWDTGGTPPAVTGADIAAIAGSPESNPPRKPGKVVGYDRLELSANGLRVRCSTN